MSLRYVWYTLGDLIAFSRSRTLTVLPAGAAALLFPLATATAAAFKRALLLLRLELNLIHIVDHLVVTPHDAFPLGIDSIIAPLVGFHREGFE